MVSGKEGLIYSAAFLASGIAAGGLSLLLRDPDVAQFTAKLAHSDSALFTNGISCLSGLYSIGATAGGAFLTPYYAAKMGLEKLFGTDQQQ